MGKIREKQKDVSDKKINSFDMFFRKFYHSVYFKYFLTFLFIFLVALIPLLLANARYCDDISRMNYGQTSGGFGSSRYLSSIFSWFIYSSHTDLPDIAPFPQILAVILMALTATILIRLLTNTHKYNFWYCLAAVPVGIFPYFLQCYSYRFDSVYMAFSAFVSVVPFLFYRDGEKNIRFVIAGILSQLAMCMTYQASSGIFPSVAVIMTLLLIHKGTSGKEILKFIGCSVLSYVIGLLIFKVFLMGAPIKNEYLNTKVWDINELFSGAKTNYELYVEIMKTDFKRIWFILSGALIFCFVVSNVLNTKRDKILEIIFSCIALGLLALFAFGVYPILEKPLFEPRAMYGIGIDLGLIGILAVDYKKAYVPKIVALCLAYSFFVASLVYGNAVRAQKDYADFRLEQTISDLKTLKANGPLEVEVRGGIGYDNVARRAIEDYPFIERILHEYFGNNWTWDTHYLFEIYSMPNFLIEANEELNESDMKKVISNGLETIYQKDNKVLVVLKSKEQFEETPR